MKTRQSAPQISKTPKRPMTPETTEGSSYVTTPRAAQMMQLLGAGTRAGSITLTRDEFKAIKKMYGYVPEKKNQKPPPPEPPKGEDFEKTWEYQNALSNHKDALALHAKWEDPKPMMQAGADRNAIREASEDGLRMLAWIAKYVPKGEDPLKTLVMAASQAGWDVDAEDVDWADSYEEETEDV